MEFFEIILWVIGVIGVFLILAGLQRKFSPQTMANGFMSMDKLKEICPELFKRDNKNQKKK